MGLFSSLFGGSKPKQNTPNVKVTMKPVANPNPKIEIPPLQGDYGRPEDMESGVAAFDSIKALLSK